MKLRTRLLFSLAPPAIALALVGAISASVTSRLADHSRLILADNYRSVLAAQRMKESLERIDSNALYVLAGHDADAAGAIAGHQQIFERELNVAEGNITEQGEHQEAAALREEWNGYGRAIRGYLALTERAARDKVYFGELKPRFADIKHHADEILALNQDAMVRKSDRVADRARRFEQLVTLAVVLTALFALLAATWLIARVLRPLGVVSAAVRRFGEGDLKARAAVRGQDEIATVAAEFNRMAEKLQRYRESSLGELLAAQQAAQAAIDGLPDPVLLLNATSGVQGVNSAASSLLGVDADRAGAEALDPVEPGARAIIDRLRGHVLGGKGAYVPKGFEDAVRVPIGATGERIFLPRGNPIYNEAGAVMGAAIVFQDVTALFRFDELKNDLVATVAHEFRTPLTSLRMAIHLCTEETVGPLTPKQADLLFAAREDCERLQVIVDELLDLSRIESGNIDLQRRRTEPEALVAAALDNHLAAATAAHTTLRSEVPPGLGEVFVDPDRLQLVFSNLIANAIRFAPKGSEIVVRATPERFEVRDTGPGIPVAHQAGLFEKFFRVPGSPEGGFGLGLFIAKGIVQAHGGEIGLESESGKGAAFWFTVPAAPR